MKKSEERENDVVVVESRRCDGRIAALAKKSGVKTWICIISHIPLALAEHESIHSTIN